MSHAWDVLNSEVMVLDHLLVCSLHDTLSYANTGAKLPAVCTLKSRLPEWLHEFQSRFQRADSWKQCPVCVCACWRGAVASPIVTGDSSDSCQEFPCCSHCGSKIKKKKKKVRICIVVFIIERISFCWQKAFNSLTECIYLTFSP